jgi:threonine synthase
VSRVRSLGAGRPGGVAMWHPAFFHGTQTIAYELWEQLGGRAPEWVVAPVGHGTLLLGLALGFREL